MSTNASREYVKSTAREYFESICVAVILALFVRTFVLQAFKIPTGSMEENILIGDRIFVNKMVYAPTNPLERAIVPVRNVKRSDVVVFKYPNEPDKDYIKRVIALPGETIRIEDKRVFIDGEPLDEPYAHFTDPNVGGFEPRRDNMPELEIPEDHYFVMGDNRDNSSDSRFWDTLPAHLVKGRAVLIYWSYESGEGAYAATTQREYMAALAADFVRFFTKARWSRFFHLVR